MTVHPPAAVISFRCTVAAGGRLAVLFE